MRLFNKIKKFLRKKYKSFINEKINIVFVCHRPSIWHSLEPIYNACINDDKFNVTIVTIPNKKQLPLEGLSHEIYVSEGAEDFFKNYKCNVLNGYNYETKTWFNLKSLKPDYLFFQTPYNICRPKQYNSRKVSKYTTLCYVHYGMLIFKGKVEESVYPVDFMDDVDIIFPEFEYNKTVLETIINNTKNRPKYCVTGYTRFDDIFTYKDLESSVWNFPKNDKSFRILWTPRWNNQENNCHFFEYKDKFFEYTDKNKKVDFVFRPHPQMFLELLARKEITDKELELYKSEFDKRTNASIDNNKRYLDTFFSSDVLVSDITSIMVEYMITGKPIIYCHKTDWFNDFGAELSEGFYRVNNWEELEQTLEMLKSGKDPLYNKRQEIMKKLFYIPEQGAGNIIKNYLREDFYGKHKFSTSID